MLGAEVVVTGISPGTPGAFFFFFFFACCHVFSQFVHLLCAVAVRHRANSAIHGWPHLLQSWRIREPAASAGAICATTHRCSEPWKASLWGALCRVAKGSGGTKRTARIRPVDGPAIFAMCAVCSDVATTIGYLRAKARKFICSARRRVSHVPGAAHRLASLCVLSPSPHWNRSSLGRISRVFTQAELLTLTRLP